MRIVIPVLILFALVACSSHIITKRSGLSSDTIYVHFANDASPSVHKGYVGGEHTSLIKILAFRGEKYRIELFESAAGVQFHVANSKDISMVKNGETVLVTINAAETLVEISLNAHPDGKYSVRISKQEAD
jgi:hypothetical protein